MGRTLLERCIDFTCLLDVANSVQEALRIYLRREKRVMLDFVILIHEEEYVVDGRNCYVEIMKVCGDGTVFIYEYGTEQENLVGKITTAGESFSFTNTRYKLKSSGQTSIVISKTWMV